MAPLGYIATPIKYLLTNCIDCSRYTYFRVTSIISQGYCVFLAVFVIFDVSH